MIYVLSGGVKLFAAIGVTYPEGSTLTCTNGTKTLKAKTTTGQWVFAIPEAGTWTVTATDGTDTDSQAVTISTEGQFEEVTLSYQFVLFSAETGLASGYTLGTGAISDTGLKTTYSGDVHTIAINEPIDVTGYETMTVKFGTVYGGYYVGVGLRNSYSTQYEGYGDAWASNFAAYVNVGDKASITFDQTTQVIDISSVTGKKYFKVSAHQAITCQIESVIFE